MDNPQDNPKAVTVFYDGACPLCIREIGFYRKCKNADVINWVDVSRCSGDMVLPGLSKSDALARFHVIGSNGVLVSGGDAFREVWHALPAFRVWSRLLRPRPVAWMLNKAYDIFLTVRPALQAVLQRHSKCRPTR